MEVNTKKCSLCKKLLTFAHFSISRKQKTGLTPRCKICQNIHRNPNFEFLDLNDDEKKCSKCNTIKNLDHFSKSNLGHKGTRNKCKKCSYAEFKAKLTIEKSMYYSARKRAKKYNREFSIKVSDIVVPDKCPILGIFLQKGLNGVFTDNSPTIDRINNEKGYTVENIWIISFKANRLKNKMSLDEFKLIL